MKQILVTSDTPLPDEFDKEILSDYIPFIKTEIYSENEITKQLPTEKKDYDFIITSKHSAQAVQNIPLDGEFFVVGKNTAKELLGQNREIAFVSNYSEDLVERILENEKKQTYVFLKGNLSLKIIPDVLKNHNIEVIEIECYHTTLTPKKLNNSYDAIVFTSPSAIKSFFSMNEIPQNTLIFTIGKTTAQAVRKYGNFPVSYPEEITKEALVDLINETLTH
ncbi:MAG: uroporphyrinogen-III synthase [Flavobacteriaceae bacterium]|jgi:uroporphyrinogen-III synthase|nr:uroporphyrinogen-III synthase [Flavobacteriaceae bacterium]